jgi:hypothetical protein
MGFFEDEPYHEQFWEEQNIMIEEEVKRRKKEERAQKTAKQILDNSTFGNPKKE